MPTQMRLGIAGGTPTTFATTPIPAVTMTRVVSGSLLSSRSEIGFLSVLGRSTRGTMAIAAPSYAIKYQWEFSAILTDVEVAQLGALLQWQKANPNSGVRLIDEVEILDPAPSQSRPLLATTAPAWNADYEQGFGVFSVILLAEPGWRTRFARPSEGLIEVAFGAEER